MDKLQPYISVIVPVYNTGDRLRTCLDSILAQTLKNIEILLVDDGSNDPLTLDLIDQYLLMDVRIRLIRKTNGGQSSARNAGLSKALGMYVAFVDHDDILNMHMYEILFETAKKENIDVVECKYGTLTNDCIGKIDLSHRPATSACPITIEQNKDFLVNNIQIWKRICCRDFLVENHLKFDDLLWEEDVLFSFKVLISARSIYYIDEVLYFHVNHESNTTHKLGRKIFDAFKSHDILHDFLKDKKCLKTFETQYRARIIKDILFNLKVIHQCHEQEFFMEAHKRIREIPLNHYRRYMSSSKKKLMGFIQTGNFKKFKRYQAFREKRKYLIKTLFTSCVNSMKKGFGCRNLKS